MKQWTIITSLAGFLLCPLTSTFSAETPLKIVNGGSAVSLLPNSVLTDFWQTRALQSCAASSIRLTGPRMSTI